MSEDRTNDTHGLVGGTPVVGVDLAAPGGDRTVTAVIIDNEPARDGDHGVPAVEPCRRFLLPWPVLPAGLAALESLGAAVAACRDHVLVALPERHALERGQDGYLVRCGEAVLAALGPDPRTNRKLFVRTYDRDRRAWDERAPLGHSVRALVPLAGDWRAAFARAVGCRPEECGLDLPTTRAALAAERGAAPPPAAVSAETIAAFLNSVLACDPAALHALCTVRVPCSERLALHPTVVCADLRCGGEGTRYPTVGLLGILNGLVWETGTLVAMETSDGGTLVATETSDGGSLVRFRTVKRQDVEVPPEEH